MTLPIPIERLKAMVRQGEMPLYSPNMATTDDAGKVSEWKGVPIEIMIELDEKLNSDSIQKISGLIHKLLESRTDAADFAARLIELEPENERMREALEFYGEKSESIKRYTDEKKPDAIEALYVELVLDAGAKARAALNEKEFPEERSS